MFIQCSSCNSKYLVNSADLKPNGRMVECAYCSHQWYQEINTEEELLSTSVPSSKIKQEIPEQTNDKDNDDKKYKQEDVKNLPSTFVKEQKVSVFNSFLVVIILISIIIIFWLLKSYGSNLFVLVHYYINEFYFNLYFWWYICWK